MALIRGKATFIKFKTVVPENMLPGINQEQTEEFFSERIPFFKFKDIDDTFDEYSVGWVSAADMLDSDFTSMNPVFFGSNLVVMSMRYDERKVPPAILNKVFGKACKARMEERQLPRLSRSMKIEIKKAVSSELIRKSTPAPTEIDVYYDIEKQEGIFFSANKSAFAIFEDLFKLTFGLLVNQVVPYSIGKESRYSDCINEIYPHLKGDNVALADIIEDTRSLGQEFLLWLWWYSETQNLIPITYGDGVAYVSVGNNIVLESASEKITCSGLQSDLSEAKLGVFEGKSVDQVGFIITYDEQQYTGSMNAMFEFKSVGVPKISTDDEEGELDQGGMVLARAHQFVSFIEVVRLLFVKFLSEREGCWGKRKGQIAEWAEGDTI